jgi:osmoprotectant transport system ATP-binding protein
VISFKGVAKSFTDGQDWAVRDLSFEVASGELFVLLGESGCGKTTTLKMINRLLDATKGSIRVDGEDIHSHDPVSLRRRIGYVIQEVGLFPHMTVAENAGSVLHLLGQPKEHRERRAHEVLELVGLDAARYAQRYPAELSGGQRQRVGVARALAARPRVMLLDEPFGALDPITRNALQAEFRKLHRELKLTAVMVTHDIHEALLLADRIAIFEDGSLVALGTPHALLKSPGHPYAEALLSTQREQAERIHRMLSEDSDS